MRSFSRIIYGLAAASYLPVITTYFAYGNLLEIVYMSVSIGALATLIMMILRSSKSLALWAFILNTLALIVQFENVWFYWFEDKGGAPIVRIVFTALWLVVVVAVVMLFRESKILNTENT